MATNSLNEHLKLSITGVMIKDENGAGITGYFAEFPEVIAQGENEEDVVSNLFEALSVMLEFKKEEAEAERNIDNQIRIKSFELELK